MTFRQRVTSQVLAPFGVILLLTATTQGQLIGNIIDINFDDGTATNAGIGPNGVALGGAGETIFSDGAFTITDLDATDPQPGLSIPFDTSAPSPFGGSLSWTLSFDFATDGGFGPLFQALGDTDDFSDDPPPAAGSIAVVLTEEGGIDFDLWFVGGNGTGELDPPLGPLNDGEFHTVELSYSAATGQVGLSVNGSDEVFAGEEAFARPANALDRVVFGELVLNGDIAGEDFAASNQICECTFDNITAESFPPPPEPALTVQLDAATGAVSIVGTAETDAITGFTVTAGAGNLDPSQYTGVAGVFDSAGDATFDSDDAYTIVTSDASTVSEADIEADGADTPTVIADQVAYQIGGPGFWQPLPFVDLEVTATTASGEETLPGGVVILNEAALPLVGDIAGDVVGPGATPDGDVDIFDYLQLLDVFDDPIEELSAFEAYYLGDLDGNQFKNLEDIIAFRTAFDEANGAGAFAVAVAALSVPEPSSLIALAAAGLLVGLSRGGRGLAFAALFAVGLAWTSDMQAQTTLFNYEFDTDFSNSEGPTGAATVNAEAFFGPPTVVGGEASFPGSNFSYLNVPVANPATTFTSDFTLSLDFASTGNTAGVGPTAPTAGVVLFSAANLSNPEESFSVYVSPEGDLEVDFVGSDGFAGCFGCGLLDGSTYSVEVIYDAPDELDAPGQLALRVNGSVVDLNGETAVGLDPAASYEVSIGGHAQRELNEGDFAFPTGFEEAGVFFAIEMQGTIDNVKLTDAASIPSVLGMTVDLTSGEMTLNGGEFARDIITIEIGGDEGTFLVDNWNSLSDQNLDPAGTGPGETWDEFLASDFQLIEGRAIGSSLLDESDVISLGAVFDPAALGNFVEAFVGAINPITGEIQNIEVPVEFVNLPGDANDDGVVDAADLDVWRANYGRTDATKEQGDFNGDTIVDAADYTVWGDAAALLGPGEDEEAAVIPEPSSSILLVLLGVTATGGARRAGRRRTARE